MTTDRLQQRINDFENALARLKDAIAQPHNEFMRDAVIQRFEFTYELAWKLLKLRLFDDGIMAATPREALQQSLSAGWIADGNAWSEMQRNRNLTSHTYDEAVAIEVHTFVCAIGVNQFIALSNWTNQWRN